MTIADVFEATWYFWVIASLATAAAWWADRPEQQR